MDERLIQRAQAYASRHHLQLAERLGSGIHGIVFVAEDNSMDFAGAYLNLPPEFPEETWAAWAAEKQEQFDVRWPKVQAVLEVLETLDIHMVDVSPGNIAFLYESNAIQDASRHD